MIFIKFTDVITAIRLPNSDDFALVKSEKMRKRNAVRKPIPSCENKIPNDIFLGLAASVLARFI